MDGDNLKNLKEMSTERARELLDKVYNDSYNYKLKLFIRYNNTYSWWNVETNNKDCKVGNFGKNYWFRTPKAVEGGSYKSLKTLLRAVEKVAEGKGLKVVQYKVEERRKDGEGFYTVEEGSV